MIGDCARVSSGERLCGGGQRIRTGRVGERRRSDATTKGRTGGGVGEEWKEAKKKRGVKAKEALEKSGAKRTVGGAIGEFRSGGAE